MSFPHEAIITAIGLKWENGGDVRADLSKRFGVGEMVLVQIEKFEALRSMRANAYYWSVVLEAIHQTSGQAVEEIHDAMCALFLPNEHKRVAFFNRLTGNALTVDVDHRRTSKLSPTKFYDFVERVRQWAYEFYPGIIIPDPDAEYWRKRTSKGKAA